MLREVWWQGAEEPEREVQNVYQELIPRQYTSSHYEHSKKAVILYLELPFRGVLFVVGTLLNLLRPLVSKAAVGDVLQELLRRFRKSIGASGRLCLLLLIFSMFNAEEYRNTVWLGKKHPPLVRRGWPSHARLTQELQRLRVRHPPMDNIDPQ